MDLRYLSTGLCSLQRPEHVSYMPCSTKMTGKGRQIFTRCSELHHYISVADKNLYAAQYMDGGQLRTIFTGLAHPLFEYTGSFRSVTLFDDLRIILVLRV